MRKILIFILICLFIQPVIAEEEYELTQADIDKFLSFADSYLVLAKKYVKDNADFGLEDYYYSDSDELMDATDEFLEKYGWDFYKINDFIYIVRITLDYISLMDAYGDILGEEMESLGEDITPAARALVRKNIAKLEKYFRLTDYTDFDEYDEFDAEPVADITDVTGSWYLESDTSFVWNFKKDGTFTIELITPQAADVSSWKGTYKFSEGVLTIKPDKPHPFPIEFTVAGNLLIAEDDALIQQE